MKDEKEPAFFENVIQREYEVQCPKAQLEKQSVLEAERKPVCLEHMSKG